MASDENGAEVSNTYLARQATATRAMAEAHATAAQLQDQGTNAEWTSKGQAIPAPSRIPGYVLRTAIEQAEVAAGSAERTIKELSGERDRLVRQLGDLQGSINELTTAHGRLTRHVRDLQAAG